MADLAHRTAPLHPARLHLPHGLVAWPRDVVAWIEPWYMAYALLAVVQGGMLPMLLPLAAGGGTGAGVVVGALNLAGLSAPVWGHVADTRQVHRAILIAGMAVIAAALAALPFAPDLWTRAAIAALIGLGYAGANTVSSMFIVERRPAPEWDSRLGALQACTGAGQVGGLLAAGFFGGASALAFTVAAGLVATALLVAAATVRGGAGVAATPRRAITARAPLGGEGWAGAPQRSLHRVTAGGLRRLREELGLPYVRLLLVWFPAFIAITAVLSMFPLAMARLFHMPTRHAAETYALAAAVSLPLYGPAAAWARRSGARRVLGAGFAWRAVALVGLALACRAAPSGQLLALACFVALVTAWPLLGVAGTALAAQTAPVEKGEALGLFNASSSLAAAIGALLGGWALARFGYGAVAATAALVVAGSALAVRIIAAIVPPPA